MVTSPKQEGLGVKGYRVVLEVEASHPVIEFTGRLTKAFVYVLNPELQLVKGVKGVLSPIHISPLFRVSGDHELGDPAYPYTDKSKNIQEVKPVCLNGEYIFHIGGEQKLIDHVVSKLAQASSPIFLRIHDTIVKYRVEKIIDSTNEIFEKATSISEKVRVYLKSPAQVFNVFIPTKLPKFTPSAVELLLTPYAILSNTHTVTENLVISSFQILGKLVETWYSLRTLKPMEIIFKNKKQIVLAGSVTYIIQENNPEALTTIQRVLATAELAGIGRSRQNGFGTTVVAGLR